MKQIAGMLLVLLSLVAGIVYSHSGATGIVKERMDAMEVMSDKSKSVGAMFKGKTEFDIDKLADAAEAFALHGAQMTELFPDTEESRTGSKTEALPRVWEDWEEFSDRAVNFVELSERLKSTVSSTDDVRQLKKAFYNVARECSGCHKRFRKPRD